MKRLTILIYILFICFSIHSQEEWPTERVFVHLDKDYYIAGEDLLAKFYVINKDFQPSTLSKVGYIEICDTERPQMQLKLALDKGHGSGKIKIPSNIPTGIYQLSGYTRYMRNEGESAFFNRQIAIINMYQQTASDRIEPTTQSESIVSPSYQEYDISILTDKKEYSKREKVVVTLNKLPSNIEDLVISVTRNDSVISLPSVNKRTWMQQSPSFTTQNWLPEYEGHIITGKLSPTSEENYKNKLEHCSFDLGFIGKNIHYTKGLLNPQDETVSFYTGNIYGKQEIVSSIVSEVEVPARLNIISPFSEMLPQNLPILKIPIENERLMERFIGVQLQEAMVIDSTGNLTPLTESYYNLAYHLSYDLDEYTRFPTMMDTFIEFVKRIIVRKIDGKQRIKVLMERTNAYNAGNTLVLLDGIPIHNHEDILNYNPRHVKKIDIYQGKYVFGGDIFECMISFITKRTDLPAIKLNDNSQMASYDCPSLPEEFIFPDYSQEAIKNSQVPDYRHTLYWNPSAVSDCSEPYVFYTSDLSGDFKITVEGFTRDGTIIYGETVFQVTN